MITDFFWFILRPEKWPKDFATSRHFRRRETELVSMARSSAKANLLGPEMTLSLQRRISKQRMKRKGERGQPCFTPLLIQIL